VKSISLIITDKTNSKDLLQSINALDLESLEVMLVWFSETTAKDSKLLKWVSDNKVTLKQIPFPDDELHLRDLMEYIRTDFWCFFKVSEDYPVDYFTRIINLNDLENTNQPAVRKGPFLMRMLKAGQQSKYGLGILRKDIQRDFSSLDSFRMYFSEDFKTGSILELSVDEDLAFEVSKQAERKKIKSIKYLPDYKKVVYYEDLESYISAVKKEVNGLSFKKKDNASWLPLYLLILCWLAWLLSFAYPPTSIFFIIVAAIYMLAISLESLAISSIKRQGELFIGLLFFFPFLHHIYLFFCFRILITGKITQE
jgi:hypothetical protein